MDDRLERISKSIYRNIGFVDNEKYNPLMFVVNELLPRYKEVKYKLKNDEMIIRKLEALDTICNVISIAKYGFSEKDLILITGFSEIKALMDEEYPKPKSMTDYITNNFKYKIGYIVKDFNIFEKTILNARYQHFGPFLKYDIGSLESKILHDVNYLALTDPEFLIKSYYNDYCLELDKDLSERESSDMYTVWLRLFTKYGKASGFKFAVPEVRFSDYCGDKVSKLRKALSSYDNFMEYL